MYDPFLTEFAPGDERVPYYYPRPRPPYYYPRPYPYYPRPYPYPYYPRPYFPYHPWYY
ncbi:hypothetical protein J7E26_07310 [Bacillus sp. ISL-51]|uniref:hypothetical protein n=1 Tax=Bacteria TaxID=2 RepID=UPI001BEC3146|nr:MULTISPECIES: hypothetical protein [Bacteria]MBT2573759.1 hypothetical protein [Bacillus sp. ISL-51]MBT2634910.1 hypothetical protein [Bacillus sp. ISL-26]MBT2712384.1 hypothetical protein [Pseudomonas sp. ISL-88]